MYICKNFNRNEIEAPFVDDRTLTGARCENLISDDVKVKFDEYLSKQKK